MLPLKTVGLGNLSNGSGFQISESFVMSRKVLVLYFPFFFGVYVVVAPQDNILATRQLPSEFF